MAGRFGIEVLSSAAREFEALPRDARASVADAIDALAAEPRPDGAKLLSGTGRERIGCVAVGQYRILSQVLYARIIFVIVRVADRREAYNATAIKRLLGRVRGSR